MKKLIRILVVIALLLVMAIAGVLAYIWYQETHIFVEDAVYALDSTTLDLRGQDISVEHYESVREQLPGCEIFWDAPFQDKKYSNDTTMLSIESLAEEDLPQLAYFAQLKTVDAMNCREYALLEALKAMYPGVEVRYQVSLGAKSFAPDVTELELEKEDYVFETLVENLRYLPDVTAITLRRTELSAEQVAQLEEAYPEIVFTRTVELLGEEYDVETTELNLSAMTSEQVAQAAQQLAGLPNVVNVDLMSEEGLSNLTKSDVRTLMEAAPNAVFHYVFDFYGYKLSTADEEVEIKQKNIGQDGVEEVRAALDIMTNCKRFVLDSCRIPNETMAQIRNEYRGRTKVVWRVNYGEGHTLTDAVVIRAVYDLVDDNCHNLIYCEDAKYMDIGHNEWLDACDFVSGMVSLEYVIISGAPIKSLEPFRNCKNLKLLEAAFCEYITDVSPLAECTNLQMLNISNTHVKDLSPLDNLPLTHLTVRNNPSGRCRLSQEEQDRVIAQHPDCWISFSGAQPYGVGWRYDEDDRTFLDHYKVIRTVFRLALDPNIPNHVGWYLKEDEQATVDALEKAMDEALAQRGAAPEETEPVAKEPEPTEPVPTEETTPPQETTSNT